ncbi:MAG: WD40 repeat domain-containing protein [Anaerolineae bacterium]|nr:WD40 repeat domain-containing protein [Anaerolineae bacterium]
MRQFTNRTLLTIFSLFCFLTIPTLAQDADTDLAVVAVDWHPDGYMFAEVLSDGQVKLIDWLNGEVYASVTTDGTAFLKFAEVEWNQSGDMLAAGIGMYVYIWDYPSINHRYQFLVGDPAGEFYVESGDWIPEQIETLSWSPDNRIAVVALSGRVTVWDVEGSQLLSDFTVGNVAQAIVWTEDFTEVTNSLAVYDVETGNKTSLPPTGFLAFGARTSAARQDNTNVIAISDVFGNADVYDLTTTTLLGQYDLSETNAAIWDISWEPDSNRFATVDDEGIVSIVDIDVDMEHDPVMVVQDFDGRLFAVDWHPKEDMLLVGGISNDGNPVLETILID